MHAEEDAYIKQLRDFHDRQMQDFFSQFERESCTSACSGWNEEKQEFEPNFIESPDFDKPITCKRVSTLCYQQLSEYTQDLNKELQQTLNHEMYFKYPSRLSSIGRCKAVALLCRGANPDTVRTHKDSSWSRTNITALHLASWFRDYRFAKFLLSLNANVNAKDSYDGTVLHTLMTPDIWHKGKNDTRIARLLLKKGADVNAKDLGRLTPLMELARMCTFYNKNDISLIKEKAATLLKAGAETHHRTQPNTLHTDDFDISNMTAREIAQAQQRYHPSCAALADFLQDYEVQQSRVQE